MGQRVGTMMGTMGSDHGGCCRAERGGRGVGKLWWIQGAKSQRHSGYHGTDLEHQGDTTEKGSHGGVGTSWWGWNIMVGTNRRAVEDTKGQRLSQSAWNCKSTMGTAGSGDHDESYGIGRPWWAVTGPWWSSWSQES